MAETVLDNLKNLNATSLLKKKKLNEFYYQATNIDDLIRESGRTFHKEIYDRLFNEIFAIGGIQVRLIVKFIDVNEKMIDQKPTIHKVLPFINSMKILLETNIKYRERYGLESELIGKLLQLKEDYESAINKIESRGANLYKGKIIHTYKQFVDIEFGLLKIDGLCRQIKNIVVNGLELMGSLKHPTKILRIKEDLLTKNKEGVYGDFGKDIARNKEILGKMIMLNEEEIKLSKILEMNIIKYFGKREVVNAFMDKLRSI